VIAAVLINLPIFLMAVGVLLVLLIVVSALHRAPSRPCPNCGASVKLTASDCAQCRYRLASYTFRR
jgi:hypothetical protein